MTSGYFQSNYYGTWIVDKEGYPMGLPGTFWKVKLNKGKWHMAYLRRTIFRFGIIHLWAPVAWTLYDRNDRDPIRGIKDRMCMKMHELKTQYPEETRQNWAKKAERYTLYTNEGTA